MSRDKSSCTTPSPGKTTAKEIIFKGGERKLPSLVWVLDRLCYRERHPSEKPAALCHCARRCGIPHPPALLVFSSQRQPLPRDFSSTFSFELGKTPRTWRATSRRHEESGARISGQALIPALGTSPPQAGFSSGSHCSRSYLFHTAPTCSKDKIIHLLLHLFWCFPQQC